MIPVMITAAPAAFRLLVVVLAFYAEPDAKPDALIGKVVHIADGDTLTVLDADKVQHKIRLAGIDAPEKSQAFGTKANDAISTSTFAVIDVQ